MSNFFALYLNKNAEKSVFDRIAIYKKEGDMFTVYYKPDATAETVSDVSPTVISFTAEGIEEYLEDVMDLLHADIDVTPYTSIDVIIPALPIASISTTVRTNKDLLISVARRWMRRT
jgi:hypothetical protein